MRTLLGIFQIMIFLGSIFLFFVSIVFYPKLITKKSFIGKLLRVAPSQTFILFLSIVLFLLVGGIEVYKIDHIYSSEEREQYYADIQKQDSKKAVQNENSIENKPITVLSDSAILRIYKQEFDSLYNKLISLDKVGHVDVSRSQYHKKIQNLLYERWWNTMESVDSTFVSLPLSYKEYRKAGLLYDKQLARFVIYGNEDEESINFWAKERAKTILKQTLVDPKSLVIEDVICCGKTQKGWKCEVIYRAKNGFGGYVREKITVIMRYNYEFNNFNSTGYECILYQ